MEKPNLEVNRSQNDLSPRETKETIEAVKKEKMVFRLGVSPTDSTNKRIGALRTHLYNYGFAKSEKMKGADSAIIYRVDDTNKAAQSKEKTLSNYNFFTEVLGLEFDVTPYNAQEEIGQSVFQSERQEVYKRSLEILFDKHIAFVDPESGLTLFDIEKFIRDYVSTVEIDELLRGKLKFKLEEKLRQGQKYFPLIRSDGSVLYHFASVVDDGSFGVTHVIRGADKLSIADYQEMIRIALDLQPKKYLHTPLLATSGKNLPSKTIKFDDLVRSGILPQALVSYMISSGYGDPGEIYPTSDEFIKGFNYNKIHKNNGYFDTERLANINKKILRRLPKEIFLESFSLYLGKNGQKELLDKLNDVDIATFLDSLRRDPSESQKIMENIFNPEYEPIKSTAKPIVKYLFDHLSEQNQSLPSWQESGYDMNSFSEGIRWILVGQHSFPNIDIVFSYLKSKKLLQARIEQSKQVFLKQVDDKLI